MGVYSSNQFGLPGFGTPSVAPLRRIDMKLVGLVVFNNQVIEDDADRLPTDVLFTPALTRTLTSNSVEGTWYAMQLAHGTSIPAVEERLIRLLPSGSDANFTVTSITETKVERAVKPESIALGVFGAIAGLAALAIGALAISRELRSAEADLSVLRALGASPATTVADGPAVVLARSCRGALLAVVVAISLSPLSPLGPVRAVYHGPAIAVDWTVLGFGLLVLVGGLGAICAGVGLPKCPPPSGDQIPHRAPPRLESAPDGDLFGPLGLRCRGPPLRAPVRSRPHRGPGPLRARGRHLGRGPGDHDAHVQQRAPHLGVTTRAVRVELELHVDLGECRPPGRPSLP